MFNMFPRGSDFFFFLTISFGEIKVHHDFLKLSIAPSAQGCLKHKTLLIVRLQIDSYVIIVMWDSATEVQQANRRKASE